MNRKEEMDRLATKYEEMAAEAKTEAMRLEWGTVAAALRASAAPGPLDEWIEREFAGHGRAIRTKAEAPYPGEPYMSMADAKELTRRAVAAFASAAPEEGMNHPVAYFYKTWNSRGYWDGHYAALRPDENEHNHAITPLYAAIAPATEVGGREEIIKKIDEWTGDAFRRGFASSWHFGELADAIRALSPSPSVGTPAQPSAAAYLRQIKAFASTINERNFLDIALHISRQADDALAISSAHRNNGAE